MNKSVQIIPFPEIENAYLIISANKKECDFDDVIAVPTISFFYDNNGIGTEWCPPHGPIQVWHKSEDIDSRPHYFYGHVSDGYGNWSQLAVERNSLPQSFLEGNYKYIFAVLKEWSQR